MQALLDSSAGSTELQWLHGLRGGLWAQDAAELEAERQLERFSVLRLDADGRKSQSMHALAHIEPVARSLLGAHDSYVSQASFVGTSRRKSMFARVRACWVDLDLHKEGIRLDAQTVREIRAHCTGLGLPEPSLIVASGRGAYCKWILERAVTSLPAWDAAQSMLVVLFQRFLADKRARDACRVFRMLGTRNSKVASEPESVVRVIDGSGQETSFEALALALEAARQQIELPSVDRTGADRRRGPRSKTLNRWSEELRQAAEHGSIEELDLYSRLREPILSGNRKTAATLGWARFCDLRDLFIRRGGIPVGQRDLAMFWMVNALAHAGVVSSLNWDEEITELLRAFPQVGHNFDPLEDGSLTTLYSRLKNTELLREQMAQGLDLHGLVNADELLYRPGNQHLIDAFDISDEEQQGLRTLISPQERQRRRDAKAPGRAERREQRQQLRERILEWLQSNGWVCTNIAALARQLGEAVGKVWRHVRALLAEHQAQSDRRGEVATATTTAAAAPVPKGHEKPAIKDARAGRWVPMRQFWAGGALPGKGATVRHAIPRQGCLGPGRLVRETVQAPLYLRVMLKHVRYQRRAPTAQELARLLPTPAWMRAPAPGSAVHRLLQRVRTEAVLEERRRTLTEPAALESVVQQARDAHRRARDAIQQAQQATQERLRGGIERLRQRIQELNGGGHGYAK